MPKVSVIVPNYNHARYLKQRIDSILSQSYQDFELILLDDCSTDNSRDIIESYRNAPHISHIVYNETNGGSPFAQWNKGIKLACGEWIWIAESDDVADNMFLEVLLSYINNPSVGLIYSHLKWIDAEGNEMYSENNVNDIVQYDGVEFIKQKLLFETTIYNVSSALFRKNDLLNIDWSLFINMKMCGDYFLYVLLSEHCDVIECKKVLDFYRQHPDNTSGNKLSSLGWGIIEGMPILNRIVNTFKIRQNKYALHYARMWRNHKFSHKINMVVAISFLPKHWLVVLYFILLKSPIQVNSATRV